MDIRIGVIHSLKEIEVELAEDIDRDELRTRIDDAIADDGKTVTLWLTDRSGREIGISSAKIAYVELGRPDTERRIGFGS